MVVVTKEMEQEFSEVIYNDPLIFAHRCLGVTLTPEQEGILLIAAGDYDKAIRLAVRSCHGVGKSFILAVIVLWFVTVFKESEAIVTANTWDQARSTIWAEVRRLHARAESRFPLGGDMQTTQWMIGPKHFAQVISPIKPDAASGKHAPHILQVVDEASGLTAEMAEAFEGNMSSGHAVLIYSGNPLRPSGPFYDAFYGTIADEWDHVHVSALDGHGKFHIPSTPGLTTEEWVELRRKEWGEGSPAWQARVLGQFPDAAEDSLIPLSLVVEAEKRVVSHGKRRKLGIDSARFGGDETVFVVCSPNGVLAVEGHRNWRETHIAGRAKEIMTERSIPADEVSIDVTGGYGAGAADILLAQDLEVNEVNFGSAAMDAEQFANKRAEMYWHLMLALRDDEFSLARAGSAMGGQLAAITKGFDGKSRIRLEPKEKVKKRVGRSPDHADALALCFSPKPVKRRPRAMVL